MPRSSEVPGSRARLERLERASGVYLTERSAARDPDRGRVTPESLERVLEISRAMNRTHDLQDLLGYVTERLRELFDAENGFVVLFDEDAQPRVEFPPGAGEDGTLPVSETILQRVRRERQPVLIDNTAELEELRNQSSIERLRIASVLCAPLVVNEEVIGVLQFDHRGDPHPFSPEDLHLLSIFADQAATAFNNLHLIESLERAREKVQVAHGRVVQAERLSALGEMAAGMAHDFNNTLFVALGFCDVLLARESLETDVRSALERIRTCSLDAANTVRRLQSFARGGAVDGKLEAVDCRLVAAEMPDYTRHKWDAAARRNGNAIEMRTHLEPTPLVQANAADVREVLTNLIFNAVDAIEGNGLVEIATGERDGRVFVSVRDDGAGMGPEVQRRVFEPFFTTKGARGCGFGLSVCWSIATRLGGELTVDSEAGRGSVFTLWLPTSRKRVEQHQKGRPVPATGSRVLVIDDEPDVLDTLCRLVRALGHEPLPFTKPTEALESLAETRYDAVVTDLGMAELSGFGVARRLQDLSPDVPVVVLTGWGSDGTDEERTDNVRAVLGKPITLERLRSTLDLALAPR